MRHPYRFPIFNLGLKLFFACLKWALPGLLSLAVLSLPAPAATLGVGVAGGLGGRIGNVPSAMECAPYCIAETSDGSLLSLFALPDEGYRFDSWEGACAGTLGPLCTLRPGGDTRLSARFAKNQASQASAKALLLLHGEGAKNTVWNEFAKQRFNDRCPVIYGGVVLGDDAYDPQNKAYCYRIAFGYYDLLQHGEAAAKGLPSSLGDPEKPGRVPVRQLAYEVRAAVLGILGRHPKLSLTLVGQGRAALAAQSFMQADTAERKRIVGLLVLQEPRDEGESHRAARRAKNVSLLKLQAGPEQVAKISAALTQLAPSRRMPR